ncbi:hypothetical protein O6H91_03G093800 [Diphasiastrum complanatum]|uniref:Uncharacterized protein n=1 Tax=Diphasiastrum complanatum TaxID=34168 RepID=A0ACC2E980_DIPCM|nr:hypothetical protein O6H91_03G093800 [Diphasiastrum complanatum]
MASLRYIVQLHTDVPRAARFYAHGLGLAVTVCTLRWAELASGPSKIALMEAPSDFKAESNNSSFLSFSVADMDGTISRLLSMGAELDGQIRYETHGKVAAVRCLDGHLLGLYEPGNV